MDPALIIAIIGSLAAVALTVLPVFPGSLVVPGSAVLCGVLGDWQGMGWWFWVAQGVLVVASAIVDNGAQAIGVKRFGASNDAMLGGVVGTIAGPFVLAFLAGPFAIVVGAPIGAVAGVVGGEFWHRHRHGKPHLDSREATVLGISSLVTWLVSVIVRLALVSLQIILLLIALF